MSAASSGAGVCASLGVWGADGHTNKLLLLLDFVANRSIILPGQQQNLPSEPRTSSDAHTPAPELAADMMATLAPPSTALANVFGAAHGRGRHGGALSGGARRKPRPRQHLLRSTRAAAMNSDERNAARERLQHAPSAVRGGAGHAGTSPVTTTMMPPGGWGTAPPAAAPAFITGVEYEAGAYTRSLFRLNVSTFCGIGGALRGCLGGVWKALWDIWVLRVYLGEDRLKLS